MNSRQLRRYNHRHRMEQRHAAKRFLRLNRGCPSGMLGLFATLTVQPGAFDIDPRYNWWEKQPA